MSKQYVCQNPECKKIYNIEDKDSDESTCCYDCWEALYCKAPEKAVFEKVEIPI